MLVLNNQATADDFPALTTGGCQLGPVQQGLAMEIEIYNATATVEIIYRPLTGGVRDFQVSQPFDLLPQIKSFSPSPKFAPVGFRAKSAQAGTPAAIYARVYELSDAFTLGAAVSVSQTVTPGGQPVPFSPIARQAITSVDNEIAVDYPGDGTVDLELGQSITRDDSSQFWFIGTTGVSIGAFIVFLQAAGILFQVQTSSGSAFTISDSSGITIGVEAGEYVDIFGPGGELFIDPANGMWVSRAVGNKIGFFGNTPIFRPAVTGSRGGNAALASLLTALASLGLITNSTTP